jgi:arsenate reductase
MAEGWARALHPEQIDAFSAGIAPAGIDVRAVQVMAEAGIDISRQQSKHVETLRGMTFDAVITVCGHANESCPVFPGRVQRLHAGFEDPPRLSLGADSEEEALRHYRKVRDEIRRYVQALPEILEESSGPGEGNASCSESIDERN